ncbi:MAG: FAD-dependent oxidoreductase, partial [Lentisphaeria bacterium]|nr:FAD-dependent oxidoreductase [Lentisphaeria bacterium]
MKHYDIVVCGGGIAGAAAALAAARRNKKVLIIEKQCVPGGLATSGLVYIYLPISDDHDRVVMSSITEELLIRCQEYGPFSLTEKWGGPANGNCGNERKSYLCCFSPAGYMLTLEKMLRESGAELLLETTVTGVFCDQGNRIREIEIFCGSEKEKISADCFIDATGGAFVLRMAGAKVFSEENYQTPWVMELNAARRNTFHFTGDLHIQSLKGTGSSEKLPQVLSAEELQLFLRRQYEIMRAWYDAMTPEERKINYPVHLPTMPQLRKIARIDALAEIVTGKAGVYVPDSVGVAAEWRTPAPAWETPFGALLPRQVRGAIAAGRCINS